MKRQRSKGEAAVAGVEGVSSKHIVELKSLISQEDISLRRRAEEGDVDGERGNAGGGGYGLLPKRLKIASTGRGGEKEKKERNPGVEERRARDEGAYSSSSLSGSSGGGAVVLSDEQKLALSRTMMEKKAAMYARRVRGEEEDEEDDANSKDREGRDECLVDFASKRLLAAGVATLGLWEPKTGGDSIFADPGESKEAEGKRRGVYNDLDRDDDYYYERVADREAQENIEALKVIEEQTKRDREAAQRKKKEKQQEKDKRIAKIQRLRMMNAQKK